MELEGYQDCKHSLSSKLTSRAHGRSAAFEMGEQVQQAIFGFLELQRDGIDSLMKMVKHDMRDLEIIKRRTQSEGIYSNVSNAASTKSFE